MSLIGATGPYFGPRTKVSNVWIDRRAGHFSSLDRQLISIHEDDRDAHNPPMPAGSFRPDAGKPDPPCPTSRARRTQFPITGQNVRSGFGQIEGLAGPRCMRSHRPVALDGHAAAGADLWIGVPQRLVLDAAIV